MGGHRCMFQGHEAVMVCMSEHIRGRESVSVC